MVSGRADDGKSLITNDKQRRLTPYFPESVQNKLLEELKKENRFEALTEEEEEDEEENTAEKKWSISFMKKIDSITKPTTSANSPVSATVQVTDYSDTNESDMLQKISMEQQNQFHVAKASNHEVCPTNEFPTEADFMSMVIQQNHQQANPQEAQLMGILGHNQLAPGILALYNSIQSDVMKLLSSTNIALLSSQEVSSGSPSPMTQSPLPPAPVSPLYQSPIPPFAQPPMSPLAQSPVQGQVTHYHNPNAIASHQNVVQQQPPGKQQHSPQPSSAATESSECMLPKLDPTSSVCLTGESQKQGKSSRLSSKNSHSITTPELPAIKSPLASRRSSHKRSPKTSSSSQCKVSGLKTTPSSVPLPSVGNSRSVIVVQDKVVESVAENLQKLEEKDSLTNEEVEVVLKSPADFEQSKILIHALSEIAKEEELEETLKNSKEKKKSTTTSETTNAKRAVSNRSSILYKHQKSYNNNNNNDNRQVASLDFKSSTRSPRKEVVTASVTKKSFQDNNDTPNYAKPLKRRSTNQSFTSNKTTSSTTATSLHGNGKSSEHKEENNAPSVFERLSKNRKSSINTATATDAPPSQTQKQLNTSTSKSKPSTTSRHRTVSISEPTEIQNVKSIDDKIKQLPTTKSNSTKEKVSNSSEYSSSTNTLSKQDLASRSRQQSTSRQRTTESKASSGQIEPIKSKSSSIRKIKKKKSSKITIKMKSTNSIISSSVTSSTKVIESTKKDSKTKPVTKDSIVTSSTKVIESTKKDSKTKPVTKDSLDKRKYQEPSPAPVPAAIKSKEPLTTATMDISSTLSLIHI